MNIDYSKIDKYNSSKDKCDFLKKTIIAILDKIAPFKKVTLKTIKKFPWFDIELFKVRHYRDTWICFDKSKFFEINKSYKKNEFKFSALKTGNNRSGEGFMVNQTGNKTKKGRN